MTIINIIILFQNIYLEKPLKNPPHQKQQISKLDNKSEH